MDPLSITASAITLIGICKSLHSGLKVLRNLSHVPDEITAVLDELGDFKNTLAAVCVVTNKRSTVITEDDVSGHLPQLLLKTKDLFTQIATYCGISIEPEEPPLSKDIACLLDTPQQIDLLSRFRWLKDRKKVNQHRQRLKVARLDIANYLATLSLFDTCSVLAEVRDLAGAFRKLSIDHAALQETLKSLSPGVSEEPPAYQSITFDCTAPGKAADSRTVISSRGMSQAVSSTSATEPQKDWCEPPPRNVDIVPCMSSCSCSCHRVTTVQTPGLLQGVLGTTTVQMQGVSNITPKCNEVTCRKRYNSSFTLTYRFPKWLTNQMMSYALFATRASGPQMALSTARIISGNSDIFRQAMQGNIEGVKSLFNEGLASPYDTASNYGYTSLHYAADYGHTELCDFLIKAGARRDVLDFNNHTPTDIAYDKIYSPSTEVVCRDGLQGLFQAESWLEQKQFSEVHKVVLNLVGGLWTLQEVLAISTHAINTPDSEGRTPLSWAAERGDVASVNILLKHGAKVNHGDKDGNTPLHWSCKAPSPSALRTLLNTGANASAQNKWQQSPLNWATFFSNDPTFAEILLAQAGVDIDELDMYGSTPASNAAFGLHDATLAYLLERGARVNHSNNYGTSVLLDCIGHNGHAALRVLLQHARSSGLDLGYRDARGENCLHHLARHGDGDTASLFLQALRDNLLDLNGLDAAHIGEERLTPRDVLKLRGDKEVEGILEKGMQIVDRENAVEKSSVRSGKSVYSDTFELLPQWEKDVGLKQPIVSVVEMTA